MIGLIARLKIKPGKEQAFEAAFRDLARYVTDDKVEPGNQLYTLCKSRTDANQYVVMELYSDQAAVDAHAKTKHFTEAWSTLSDCMEPGPPDFEFIDAVE